MTRHGWLGGFVLALMLMAGTAAAQSGEGSFADLPRVIKAGDRISVVGTDGQRTNGVVTAVSPTGLTVRATPSAFALRTPRAASAPPEVTEHTFQADRVVSVSRGGDSRMNGMLIGLAIGLALPIASVASATGDASDMVGLIPAVGAMGAGAGFLIDGMIGRKVTLFSAGGAKSRAELRPIMRRGTKGVALSVRF